MGVLAVSSRRAIDAAYSAPSIDDERHWIGSGYSVGGTAGSGIYVNGSSALQVSCMWHGGRLFGETVGSLPLKVYERDGKAKREQREHPLWRSLSDPNPWQTPMQFRCMLTVWAKFWGRGMAEIRPIPRSDEFQLWPILPELVRSTERLGNGKLRFTVGDHDGGERKILQDDLLILDGPGLDPCVPDSLISRAREAIGHWLAIEQYGARFFSQGAKPSFFLEHPEEISPAAATRLEDSTARAMTGLQNMHRPIVLEEGMKATPYSFDAQESQLPEMRRELVAECARWLNLPLQFLFPTGDTPTYASSETFARQAVDYSFRPLTRSWEQAIRKSLLYDEPNTFVEHSFDELLKGHTKERFESYGFAIQNGWMTVNEVRSKENMNPLDGGDEPTPAANLFGDSANQTDTGSGEAIRVEVAEPEPVVQALEAAPESTTTVTLPERFVMVVGGIAARLVTREKRETAKALKRDPETVGEWADGWYESFSGEVAEALQLPPGMATRYVESRKASLLEREQTGEDWTAAEADLVALALEGYGQ